MPSLIMLSWIKLPLGDSGADSRFALASSPELEPTEAVDDVSPIERSSSSPPPPPPAAALAAGVPSATMGVLLTRDPIFHISMYRWPLQSVNTPCPFF
jgi:hypothetical protein